MKLHSICEPAKLTHQCAIGIDLGTTNSLIAVSIDNKIELVEIDDNYLIPSVVSFSKGNILVGQPAIGAESTLKINSIKRLMGKGLGDDLKYNILSQYIDKQASDIANIRLNVGDYSITPTEISAKILQYLVSKASKKLNQPIKDIVLSVPAYFDDAARNATIAAARIANLNVIRLVNEPTAAALAYGIADNKSGKYLIYDLGGGTFDVSVLNFADNIFQVLATAGDTQIGGDDFDEIIYQYLKQQLGLDNDQQYNQLINQAKFAKLQLSHHQKVRLNFTINQQDHQLTITRKWFEQAITSLVDHTIKISQQVINEANLTSNELEKIILVGGSTRIPLIKKKINDLIRVPILCNLDPDQVVAIGAAKLAANLITKTGDLLLDVNPLSLGIELMGGVVEKIIPRNSPLPISITEQFTTFEDNQTAIIFHIVQGEREFAKDCRSLATLNFADLPPGPAGILKVSVEFTIDVNGLLRVTAFELQNSLSKQIEIKPSYGLNHQQIDDIINDAQLNAKADIKAKLLIEAKMNAQGLITAINKYLTNNSQLLDKGKLELLNDKLNELTKLLDQNDHQMIIKAFQTLQIEAESSFKIKSDDLLNDSLKGKKIADLIKTNK